jgi:uncharacterized protein
VSGTAIGGRKAGNKNLEKTSMKLNGEWITIEKGSFYKHIGSLGGKTSTGGGFAADRELAKSAGRKGGKASRRAKANAQS